MNPISLFLPCKNEMGQVKACGDRSAKEKGAQGRNQEKPGTSFWLQTALNFPSNDSNSMWQHTWNTAIQGSSPEPCPGFLLGRRSQSWRYGWPPTRWNSVSSPSRGWTDIMWPKAPTLNHIVSMDYLVWPTTSGKHLYQSGHSKSLEVTSQVPVKGQSFKCA